MFYMVAPFLGRLKNWIKSENRRDQRKKSARPAPPAAATPKAAAYTDPNTSDEFRTPEDIDTMLARLDMQEKMQAERDLQPEYPRRTRKPGRPFCRTG